MDEYNKHIKQAKRFATMARNASDLFRMKHYKHLSNECIALANKAVAFQTYDHNLALSRRFTTLAIREMNPLQSARHERTSAKFAAYALETPAEFDARREREHAADREREEARLTWHRLRSFRF